MFLVRFSFVIIIVRSVRTIGKMVILGLWPGYMVYMSWISRIIQGIKLTESVKKGVVLVVVSFVIISFNSLLLVCMLAFSVRRSLSMVALRVYVGFAVLTRLMMVLFLYVLLRFLINWNFKIFVIGVLPLPMFFIKVFGFWGLYIVILIRFIILLE